MKLLLIILVLYYASTCDSANKQEEKKVLAPILNSIQITPKYEMYYQQQPQIRYQPQPKYIQIPIQLLAKPIYIPANPQTQTPHAMIIIAQPTYIPQNVVYPPNPTQQLLNYFHNNPQAKYQLLHGTYPGQQTPATTYMQPVVSSPPNIISQNYVLAPVQPTQAQNYQQVQDAAPTQYQQTVPQQYQNVYQTERRLNALTQLAAQRTTTQQQPTPIVTGFEKFTPDQQAQIRAQLNSHLGGNYHTLTAAQAQEAQQYSAKYNSNDSGQEDEQLSQSVDFSPSPQVEIQKADAIITRTGSNIMKAPRFGTKV